MASGSLKAFQELKDRRFSLDLPEGQRLELVLDEMVIHPRVSESFEAYSLFFKGEGHGLMPQGTYTMHHQDLGTLFMFLVPKTVEGKAVVYEAVFNQATEKV
jgi:hypothetical protein